MRTERWPLGDDPGALAARARALAHRHGIARVAGDLAELRREAWGDKGKPEPAAWNNKIAEMYQGAAA